MNGEGKFLKKLWFCVGVEGGGGKERGGAAWKVFFYQLIL